MYRETADRHLPPEDHIRSASEITRQGRNTIALIGSLALLTEGVEVAVDIAQDQAALQGDLISIGVTALSITAGAAILHMAHKKFEAQASGQQG